MASSLRQVIVDLSNLPDSNEDLFPSIHQFPQAIERITVPGKGWVHKFAVWDEKIKHIWDGWWDSTPWRIQNPTQQIDWKLDKRRSSSYTHYRSIALISDGKPLLQCKRCDCTLKHPQATNSGTSSIDRHVKSNACKQSAKAQGLPAVSTFFTKKGV